MEYIMELLFEIIFDGSIEAVSSKKVPLIIRIILGIIVGCFMLMVTVGLSVFGIVMMINSEFFLGLFLLICGMLLLIGVVITGFRIIRGK